MKYKAGDLVKIVGPDKGYAVGWVPGMYKFIGKVARIRSEYTEGKYFLEGAVNEDRAPTRSLWFKAEWLELVEEDSFVELWA